MPPAVGLEVEGPAGGAGPALVSENDVVVPVWRERPQVRVGVGGGEDDGAAVRQELLDPVGRLRERPVVQTPVVVPVLGAVVQLPVTVAVFAVVEDAVVVRVLVHVVQGAVAILVLAGHPFTVQLVVLELSVLIEVLPGVLLEVVVDVFVDIPGAVTVPVLPGITLGGGEHAVPVPVHVEDAVVIGVRTQRRDQ